MKEKSDHQHQLGSLEWASTNSGALLPKEKKSLRSPILKTAVKLVSNGLRFKLGLYPKGIGKIEGLESLPIPDSEIVQKAEKECLNKLSPETITHSLRTFVFGMALSHIDEVYKDAFKNNDVFQDIEFIEHFYVTSLLHDIEIESKNTHTCFAVAGGQKTSSVASQSGRSDISKDLGNAVSMHITPEINKAAPGSLTALISEASLLDLSGYKIWKLDRQFVKDVDKNHGIDFLKDRDFAQSINKLPFRTTKQSRLFVADCWKDRASFFPDGRVALSEKFPPGLSSLIRKTFLR